MQSDYLVERLALVAFLERVLRYSCCMSATRQDMLLARNFGGGGGGRQDGAAGSSKLASPNTSVTHMLCHTPLGKQRAHIFTALGSRIPVVYCQQTVFEIGVPRQSLAVVFLQFLHDHIGSIATALAAADSRHCFSLL